MCQLIESGGCAGVLRILVPGIPGRLKSFAWLFEAGGVGRGDKAQLAVENAEQVGTVARTLAIAGRVEQLTLPAHVTFDVRPRVRQHGSQDSPGRLLMQAMIGRGAGRAEGLLQKSDPQPAGAADGLQGRRAPRLSL